MAKTHRPRVPDAHALAMRQDKCSCSLSQRKVPERIKYYRRRFEWLLSRLSRMAHREGDRTHNTRPKSQGSRSGGLTDHIG